MTASQSKLDSAARQLRAKNPLTQKTGANTIRELAESGDPLAMYALATWMLHGAFDQPVDLARARDLLEKAAEQLVPEAAYDLGEWYEANGTGKDRKRKAFGYYVLAAILGDKDAIEEVVRCFYWGNGTYMNKDVAALLLKSVNRSGG